MQVRNEVKELRLLFEVLQILDSASDLSDNLETVLEVMAEHTGMMRGVITLLDEAHGEIAIEAAYGMSAEAQSKGRYKLGEGITGNGHFMFQDLNNDVIADHIEAWIQENVTE